MGNAAAITPASRKRHSLPDEEDEDRSLKHARVSGSGADHRGCGEHSERPMQSEAPAQAGGDGTDTPTSNKRLKTKDGEDTKVAAAALPNESSRANNRQDEGVDDCDNNDHKEEEDDDSRADDDDESEYYDSEDSDVDFFFEARAHLAEILERNHWDEEKGNDEDNHSCSDSESSSGGGPMAELRTRVEIINHATYKSFTAREVRGNHRTGCNDCGTIPRFGYYAVDHSNGVYDAPKLCDQCIERQSDLLFQISQDRRTYLRIQMMRRKLEEAHLYVSPFVAGGLFEAGPDSPFRLSLACKQPKTYKAHMDSRKTL